MVKKAEKLIKLDLGCGQNKKEGFEGVDILQFDGKVDHVLDLRKSWPWKKDSVSEVHCSHFLEHLTGAERIGFFNELCRVMKPGATGLFIVPHWSSGRAYGDVTHQWPPVVEMFWYYLDKTWREANAPHVGFKCDFGVTWGYNLAHPWNLKLPEAQQFAIQHYKEVASDMVATVTKR